MNHYRAVLLLSLGLLLQGCAAKQEITHVDVFTSGQDGYHTYRIPAVETAPDGSLLVFTEARKVQQPRPRNTRQRHRPGLQAQHRRRQDLVRDDCAGRPRGALGLLQPGHSGGSDHQARVAVPQPHQAGPQQFERQGREPTTPRPGGRYSRDNGLTWSEPMDLTAIAREVEQWGSSFFGPGGAIQNAKGRLIVPVSQTTGKGDGDDRSTPHRLDGVRNLQRRPRRDLGPGPVGRPRHQREPTGRAGRWKPC